MHRYTQMVLEAMVDVLEEREHDAASTLKFVYMYHLVCLAADIIAIQA